MPTGERRRRAVPGARRAPSWVVLGVLGLVAVVAVVTRLPPWWFLTRPDLPSCGEVDPDRRTGELPSGPVACLTAAQAAGRGAELEVTAFTEGEDPVHVHYRVLPGRSGVELFVDSHDGHGDRGWSRSWCPQARAVPDVGTCWAE